MIASQSRLHTLPPSRRVEEIGDRSEGDRPALTFARQENAYRLEDVWEFGTEGLTVAGK